MNKPTDELAGDWAGDIAGDIDDKYIYIVC